MPRLCALLALLSCPCLAAESDAPRAPHRGLFLTDDWRYRPSPTIWHWFGHLVLRTGADFVSIPTNLDSWRGGDLLTLVSTTAVSVGATIPLEGRSLDARIQDGIHQLRGVNCDYLLNGAVAGSQFCKPPRRSGFHVWADVSNTFIIGSAIAIPLGLLLGGALGARPELVEAGTLAIEAFSVAQLLHLSLKLFTGRQGPLWEDGSGAMHGPSATSFPDGWPSGHAATLFSIAAVYATYFQLPWLRVLVLGTATFFATMMVIDDAHFASDVLLGAVLGCVMGRWVVHHRSSRFSSGSEAGPVRLISLAPLALEHGAGVGARFAF